MQMSSVDIISVDYEVHGYVQGVFFRKYTAQTAKSRNCVGWVKNTRQGTVAGVMQGTLDNVNFMKRWLETTGSPMSKIQRVEFSNQRKLTALEYDNFRITH